MDAFIISSNIRFSTHDDGPQAWPKRKSILARTLLHYSPLIIGTQEGREPQLREFLSLLPDFSVSDVNRSWINERMYPCLFFNTKHLQVEESGDFWLSETPGVDGSSSFGSMFPRLCTWMQASVNESSFFVFNTHLDHVRDETRHSQAKVLCDQIKKINSQNLPMILMGDFNDSPTSLTRSIIEKELPTLVDNWTSAEESSHHPFSGQNSQGDRIDWILHSFRQKVQIHLDKSVENNTWPSDHFPVVAKFKIE